MVSGEKNKDRRVPHLGPYNKGNPVTPLTHPGSPNPSKPQRTQYFHKSIPLHRIINGLLLAVNIQATTMAFEGGNLAAVEDPEERQIRELGNLYTTGYLFEKDEHPEDDQLYESQLFDIVDEEYKDDLPRQVLEFPLGEDNGPTPNMSVNSNGEINIEYGDRLGSRIVSSFDQVTDTVTVNTEGLWNDAPHMVPVPATSVDIMAPSMLPILPASVHISTPGVLPTVEITHPTGQITHPDQIWSTAIVTRGKQPPRPTVENMDSLREWQAPIAPMHTPYTPESTPHPPDLPFFKEAAPPPESPRRHESPESKPTLRRSSRKRTAPRRYMGE